ncbi:hypothetical protein CVT24_001671 [Panaeolus cyanescens]|uniref:Uncharacterized protein n=1 Tax=Panaeolus cyanescens TaxID=181874 RepID=A0A409VSP7_9AGAR|nr:hypothetical protein CVT24_001671 [Panaeolus cyanescens]
MGRCFLPTRVDAQTSDFKTRISKVYTPRWWSLAWGWTAFIPVNHDFSTSTTRALSILAHNLLTGSTRHRHHRQLSDTIVKELGDLEQDLYQASHILSLQLQISVLKPAHPWIFGYRIAYDSLAELATATQNSRVWFALWLGLLSFLISETEEEQCRTRGFPALAILAWQASLLDAGFQRSWVEDINRSVICQLDPSVCRVGTFIDLDQTKCGDPVTFVGRLQMLCVPVWYRWPPANKNALHLAALAPPSHEVQAILEGRIPVPLPAPVIDVPKRPVLPHRDDVVRKWTTWLTRKEEIDMQLMSMETEQERLSRMRRVNDPPTTSAKVFVWEVDEGGEWKRTMVAKRFRRNTLADFTPYQKVYDSFANEWDCCKEISPGSSEVGGDDEVTSYSESESTLSSPNHVTNDDAQEYVVPTMPSSAQQKSADDPETSAPESDPLCAIQADAHAEVVNAVDSTEEYILRFLRQYYGFTSSPILPQGPPKSVAEKDQNNFLKFVGIPLHEPDRSIFQRHSIVCAVDFYLTLGRNGAPLRDEFDLSREHRESLLFAERLSSVVVIPQENGNPLYMFDFGPERNRTPWRLTLLTAIHTLMVCRLPPNLQENDIAMFLLRRGIAFKTLQESNTLSRMPVVPMLSSRLIPHKEKGYVFTKADYQAYLAGIQDFLVHRRARAAMMSGGYTWRLAMLYVSPHVVLEGPTGWSTNPDEMFVVRLANSKEYIDDKISDVELELLCGLNECFTGNGLQTSKKSFYPLPSTFIGSGFDFGRWTISAENFFQRVHVGGLGPEDESKTFRQPLTMSKWRGGTRGSGTCRRAQAHVEKLASSFIVDALKRLC